MTFDELKELYDQPLFQLIERAHQTHKENWPDGKVQLCTLLSIKTGGCSENCGYCSQSGHHKTKLDKEVLLEREEVMKHARAAVENGSTRFCMGAAWKGVRGGTKSFEQVLDIVRGVSSLGLEVCVTLGQLGPEEARQLREAGVNSYNHNLDTSPEHYPNVVTTHTYDDRLKTIRNVQDAGISVCCGGILGLSETIADRLRMLEVISNFNPHPESVPINSLIPVPGTPMENNAQVEPLDFIRMIALARIALPKSKVRLSAGRSRLSDEGQALAFYAGANSIFYGEKLLTTENPEAEQDRRLLAKLDLDTMEPDTGHRAPDLDPAREQSPRPDGTMKEVHGEACQTSCC